MQRLCERVMGWLKGHDRGTVAVTFLLSLPIFLTIMMIVIQYGLMVNAKLLVERATAVAARSAMTALPTDPVVDEVDGPGIVNQSAYMALAPLSPMSRDAPTVEAAAVLQALRDAGLTVTDSYANRYTYAQEATTVSWPDQPYAKMRGGEMELTIQYRFFLSVPFANILIGKADTIAGVSGRFTTITSTVKVQLSHGRQASAGGNGWPN
jgi:hypothetical protein